MNMRPSLILFRGLVCASMAPACMCALALALALALAQDSDAWKGGCPRVNCS